MQLPAEWEGRACGKILLGVYRVFGPKEFAGAHTL